LIDRVRAARKSVLLYPELIAGLGRDPAAIDFLCGYARPTAIVSTKKQILQSYFDGRHSARERLSKLLRAANNRYYGIRKHFRKLFVYDWGLCRTRRQCSSLGTMSHLKSSF